MRIAIFIPTLGLGGAEEIIVEIANHLAQNHEVELFQIQRVREEKTRTENLDSRISVKTILPFGSFPLPTCSIASRTRSVMFYFLLPMICANLIIRERIYRADIIHINLFPMASISILLKIIFYILRIEVPIIQTFHTNSHLLPKLKLLLFRLSWRLSTHVVVEINELEESNISKVIGKQKTSFIPFGIGTGSNEQFQTRCVERVYTIGSLARVRMFEKKYDKIFEALAILKFRYGINFQYFVGGDGPDMEAAKIAVQRLGIADRVVFLGYINEREKFFAMLDVMVVATVGEDTGIAGLQGLNSGVCLVGFDTSFGNLIKGNALHFRVASSPDVLAEMLLELVDKDDRKKYYASLFNEKKRYLSGEKMCSDYENLFSGYLVNQL